MLKEMAFTDFQEREGALQIPQGACSKVRRCVYTPLNQHAVVKTARPVSLSVSFCHFPCLYQQDLQERFKREVSLLASVNFDHVVLGFGVCQQYVLALSGECSFLSQTRSLVMEDFGISLTHLEDSHRLTVDKRPSESASGGNSKAASRSDCCSKPRSMKRRSSLLRDRTAAPLTKVSGAGLRGKHTMRA